MKHLIKILVLTSIVFSSHQSLTAQMVEKSFDIMLDALYNKSIPLVTVGELDSLMKSRNIILLDSRETEEFKVSHIQGALNVGYDHFKKSSVKDLPKDKPVVVYCSVGYRSEKIGEQLQKMGFSNVFNLYGGIFKWKNENMSVVNEAGQMTDSVHTYNLLWSQWLWNGKKVY